MPIVIAGAFRNGTTLTAKLLHDVIGCYGGSKKELQPENLEHRRARQLSNMLINYYGGHWIKPNKLPEFTGKFDIESQMKQLSFWFYLATLYDARMRKESNGIQYFWKDTRLPLTLPAWHQVIDNPKYLIPYRRPRYAVDSMHRLIGKNYGFEHAPSYQSALYVWETYYTQLLDYLGKHPEIPVMGIDYEEWMFDFDRLHTRLTIFLECKIDKDQMARLFQPKRSYEQDDRIPDNPIYTRLTNTLG